MTPRFKLLSVALLAAVAAGCGDGSGADDASASPPAAAVATAAAADADAMPTPAGRQEVLAAAGGSARVRLTGGGADVDGEFPTTICAGFLDVDAGVAYQVQAGEWKITVGSARRVAGDVPLNDASGDVNVTVVANAPGKHIVRGPRNGGSLRISDDFNRADADLELRTLLGGETAKLVATFTCNPPA